MPKVRVLYTKPGSLLKLIIQINQDHWHGLTHVCNYFIWQNRERLLDIDHGKQTVRKMNIPIECQKKHARDASKFDNARLICDPF